MSTSHDQRRSIAYSQNFLRSRKLVDRLLDRAAIGPGDVVLEIGPGTGRITERLALRCRHVVAVEKDPALAARLRHQAPSTVSVHDADILAFPLPDGPYKVFASIPFNITTAIVAKLTSGSSPPDDAYLVVQREAADKFLGEPRGTLASVLLKPWFAPTVVHHFRRTDFTPVPHVDAVLLRLQRHAAPLVADPDAPLFRDFVTHAFTAWQPTLRDALAPLFPKPALERLVRNLEIAPCAPPSTVRFDQWLGLFAAFRAAGRPCARQRILGSARRLREHQAGLDKSHRTRAGRPRPPPTSRGAQAPVLTQIGPLNWANPRGALCPRLIATTA